MATQNTFNVMATQQNYSQAELEIRCREEYEVLKKKLTQFDQVTKWKQNSLEIQIYSDRIQNGIRQIKEPICFDDCQHEIIDLYDIFMIQDQEACPQCKKKPTIQNIKSETFYKNLVTKINEKAFYCSFYARKVFHKYSKQFQPFAFQLLSNSINEKYLEYIISNTNQVKLQQHIQDVISKILKLQAINLKQIIKLPLHCLINAQKIIIPIMFDGCEHLECYEYTNILKLIYDNNNQKPIFRKKIVKCFHQDCENYFELDLQKLVLNKKILFPAELSDSITKEYSFALNVSWNYQQNKFVYDKKSVMDQEIFEIIKNQLQLDNLHFQIFSILQYIVNKEIPEDLENKFKFSSYQLNLKNILYPVRCQHCPMNKCFDLFNFLSYVLKQQQKAIKCLACQNNLDPHNLESQIYFDKYLSREIQKKQNLENIFYNENNLEFKTYFMFLMQNQTLSFGKIIEIYKMDGINPYQKPECFITKKRLVYPIVLPECKNKRAFEFEIFFTYIIQKEFSLSSFHQDFICNCEFCSQIVSFKLQQFYMDPTFKKILEWFPYCWELNVKQILNQFDKEGQELKKPLIIINQKTTSSNQVEQNSFSQNQHQNQNYHSVGNLQNYYHQKNHRLSEAFSYDQCYQFQYQQSLQNNFMGQKQNQFENNQNHQPTVNNEYYFLNGELLPDIIFRNRYQKH